MSTALRLFKLEVVSNECVHGLLKLPPADFYPNVDVILSDTPHREFVDYVPDPERDYGLCYRY